MAESHWAEQLLLIAQKCNTFPGSSREQYMPLLCGGTKVGIVKVSVAKIFLSFSDTFFAERGSASSISALKIVDDLKSVEEKTVAINQILLALRDNNTFTCLKGWRNEEYAVSVMLNATCLFRCERAAAGLLGIRQYGAHLNGYFYNDAGEVRMWIGKRSHTKQTYPGMLDNMVAGGIPAGCGPLETIIKECEEEASIPQSVAIKSKPVGTISYCHESGDEIEAETEFLYDLELPEEFVATPHDGEVERYYLWDMERIKKEIAAGHFKPNCALVIANFMVRHGIITPESEPLYEKLACAGHRNLTEILSDLSLSGK